MSIVRTILFVFVLLASGLHGQDSIPNSDYWWYRTRYNIVISAVPGNFAAFSLSPQFGYQVNRNLFLSAGVVYQLAFLNSTINYHHNGGLRAHVSHQIWRGFKAIGEYEWMYLRNLETGAKDNHMVALGGGYGIPFSNRKTLSFWLMYDLISSEKSRPYPGPFMARIGITF
jgi:hypothetical protein